MKTLATSLFLLLLTPLAFALNIPSSVYRVDKLDEAIAEAIEEEKPLTFVYSNSKLKPT